MSGDTLWHEITGLPTLSDQTRIMLSKLDLLKRAWEEAASKAPETFRETRLRALRSHAIETGIIERLYDVDWGVTQAMIAEGLTLEVAEREGGVDRHALVLINDQYDAVDFVSKVAQDGDPLTVHLIRQLHQIITRHQPTYEATDALGRPATPELLHGEWKKYPNTVLRQDGTTLYFCPPERVQDQMDMLVRLYNEAQDIHPMARAAWLHHRFITIHPFQDGNGRVARTLVLLELQRGHFAPIVVGRKIRQDYLQHLDKANDGDLEPLIMFFADLEQQSMMQQFQAPRETALTDGVLAVAKAASEMLAERQAAASTEPARKLAEVAATLHDRIGKKLTVLAGTLKITFQINDAEMNAVAVGHRPGDALGTSLTSKFGNIAKRQGFQMNLATGSWHTLLILELLGQAMWFNVTAVRVGASENGVGAIIVFAYRQYMRDDQQHVYEWLFTPGPGDQVPFTSEMDPDSVWPDVDALIDRTLAAAIAEFTKSLI